MVQSGEKRCARCGRLKATAEFPRKGPGKWCTDCRKARFIERVCKR